MPAPRASHTCMIPKRVLGMATRRCLTPAERAGADIEHNGAWQHVVKAQQDRCFSLPCARLGRSDLAKRYTAREAGHLQAAAADRALCIAADPAARRRPIHWAVRLRRAPHVLA